MDKELLHGTIGSEGAYDIAIKAGNVVGSITYDGGEVSAQLNITVKSKAGLEKLKTLIPGTIPAEVINVIEAELGV